MTSPYYIRDDTVVPGPLVETALLDIESASVIHCAWLCLHLSACVMYFFTLPLSCRLYDYIPKRDLTKPSPTAFLYKSGRLMEAEKVLGSVYVHTDVETTWRNARDICKNAGGDLAMPKTEEAFWLLTHVYKTKSYHSLGFTDEVNAQFVYVDGETMGSNGYNPPMQPLSGVRSAETVGIMFRDKNNVVMLGDAKPENTYAYICQIN